MIGLSDSEDRVNIAWFI